MANSKNSPSNDLTALLQERLGRHVEPGQQVCVALSGGLDSIALLHALSVVANSLGIPTPAAIHVNHGLSPNADYWESFSRHFCDRLGLAFESRRVKVNVRGDGLEAAARKVRYAELNRLECDWIVLAHHRDDQAETVLLNLLRGTGIHGAAAMAEVNGQMLRPFLDISRAQILQYARQNDLSWIEDESNADIRYSRNFLRHQVIPLLERQFPQASQNIARAATAFAAASSVLDQIAREDIGSDAGLDIQRLTALSQTRAANLLAYYLRHHGLQIPGQAMLYELLRQLTTAARDRQIRFVISDYAIRRYHDRVFVTEFPAQPVQSIPWSGESEISWGKHWIRFRSAPGSGIDAAILKDSDLRFSPRHGGESLQLRVDGPNRPLKDLLREIDIPPWIRSTLPILYAGSEVVWVPAVGIAARYRCKPDADGVLIEFDGVTW